MSREVRFSILASGRGSNFEAIARHSLGKSITSVVTDNPEAGVLAKAKEVGVAAQIVSAKGLSRESHEEKILDALKAEEPHFIVLAGYKRIITSRLIDAFRSERGYSRIVNIHPSLLPAFPGLGSYQKAFEYGAKVTGVTVHLVDEEVDHGPILAQEAFSIADCQSLEEVERRGLAIEHRLYPETLDWALREKFDVRKEGGRVHVCAS